MAIRSTAGPAVHSPASPRAVTAAQPPPHRGGPRRNREALFEPVPDGMAETLATRLEARAPVRAGLVVLVGAYVVLSAALTGTGFVLTRMLFPDHPARFDIGTDRFLADHRTHALDGVTWVGSHVAETATVIGIAAIVVLVLLWRHRPLAAAFLTAALVIEVTVFLTATLVIDRARPAVPKLDGAPPTSSFPSGHTAAAVALYVGCALIVTSLTSRVVVRTVVWVFAIALPLYVGVSRLYRGMHFPTDVLAGVLLGACSLAAALLVVRTGAAVAERHTRAKELTA